MPELNKIYNKTFYEGNRRLVAKSAKEVVGLMMDIVKPKSVVDVGCATGRFLSEFRRRGCSDILGMDGSWVDPNLFLIPKDKFVNADFTKGFPEVNRRFDLALCLEVGEHLEQIYADGLVRYLTGLSDAVLFGAAIPGQFGAHHVNEQWQSYWAKKFVRAGYVPIDCVRPVLYDMEGVVGTYKQNNLLYVRKSKAQKYLQLVRLRKVDKIMFDIVIPESWLVKTNPKTIPVMYVIRALPYLPMRIVKYCIQKFVFKADVG